MTQKQKLFIEEYLIDLNATQAAIRAGYSPDTAQQIGSENLLFQRKSVRRWLRGPAAPVSVLTG